MKNIFLLIKEVKKMFNHTIIINNYLFTRYQINLVITDARDFNDTTKMKKILDMIDENNVDDNNSLWYLVMYLLLTEFFDEAERFFRVLVKRTAEILNRKEYTTHTLCERILNSGDAAAILDKMLNWGFEPDLSDIKIIRRFNNEDAIKVLESYLVNCNQINNSAKSARMKK